MAGSAAQAQTLDQQLTYALDQLHGCAASVADSKARYRVSGDARYLQAIENVKPLYAKWLAEYNSIGAQLGVKEMPGDWAMFLVNVSDSVTEPVNQIVGAVGDVAEGAGSLAKHADALVAGLLIVAGLGLIAYVWRSPETAAVLKAIK